MHEFSENSIRLYHDIRHHFLCKRDKIRAAGRKFGKNAGTANDLLFSRTRAIMRIRNIILPKSERKQRYSENGEHMKILFQGDSITDGNRYKSRASEWDKNHQIGHSYVYIITGLLGMQYPERKFEFINRGISGNIAGELAKRWEADALDINPDVLSILIGVNDCIRVSTHAIKDFSAAAYERNYREILRRSREKNPGLKIVLLEPFAYVETQTVENSDPEIRRVILRSEQKIVRRLAEEFNAIFVPLQEAFDEAKTLREPKYWIWDGTHPTEAGHALIAREFLKATKDIFKVETEI